MRVHTHTHTSMRASPGVISGARCGSIRARCFAWGALNILGAAPGALELRGALELPRSLEVPHEEHPVHEEAGVPEGYEEPRSAPIDYEEPQRTTRSHSGSALIESRHDCEALRGATRGALL